MTPPVPSGPAPGLRAGTAALRAVGLTRCYGEGATAVRAVTGIDVDLAPASFTAVMGPSGSGKSTLMHLLAGLDRPTAGRVLLDGEDLAGMDDEQLTAVRRTRMGFVFQAFNLFATLSAAENVDLPSTLGPDGPGLDAGWREHLVDTLGLGDLLDRRPAQLSGGQQQRVAIARALVHRPAVVFADEPTGALDLSTGRDVLHVLADLAAEQQVTVVMVTHDAAAASTAERVLVLADGHLLHDLGRTGTAELATIALAAGSR